MEIALIVNPYASQVTEERVRAVEAELGRAGSVTTMLTERPGHATELATTVPAADALVVFSGDGGFNEAINGLAGDAPVGFLPGGHTSVLPRALGLPRDPVAAAARVAGSLAEGRERRISVGRVNGRRFAFAAGIGLDADLVRRVDQLGRALDGRRPGDLAYVLAAAKLVGGRLGRFEPALDIEGIGRAAFALVANTDPYTFAGPVPIHVAPKARFELGLDVLAPERVRPHAIPRLLRYVLRGRGQTDAPGIWYGHDLDRIAIACDRPLPLQADGEDLGDAERVTFEAERGALRVLI